MPAETSTDMTGGCQCGAVRFRATDFIDNAHVCHCRMCQKASGNLFAPLIGVPDIALKWTRGTPAVFESSDVAERGFCRDCGTPLFYHYIADEHHSLMMGCFDDPAALPELVFEAGMETRLPQLDQLARVSEHVVTEEADPEEADRVARSNRQFSA